MTSKSLSVAAKGALVLALLLGLRVTVAGAPFAERVPFTQPDGTQIELWGEGDDFYAVFETLDGYTVVFNPQSRAYEYADLTADGSQLVPSGVAVGSGIPTAKGLKQHLRINADAIRKQVATRYALWDEGMEVSKRWEDLKTARRLAEASDPDQAAPKSPPSTTTTGQRLGLTLLIDFSDAVATVPQADINNLCNGDNYTGYGNNGSVKKYFLDVSNNQLTYSNVVTVYVRAPQPKTNYNDTTIDEGVEGRKLITDVLNVLKALPNYTNNILPTFADLSVDSSSRVRAFNVYFAGANSGVWAKGLWPHSYSLSSAVDLGNGKKVYRYQITNIGTSPGIGTFCHENGHMLCGFPDLYDYGYDSKGGAGNFCLMGSGNGAHTPVQVCAYLKRAAGWATTTDWTSNTVVTATVGSSGTNFNRFYRYAKPGVSTEYFLIENRQKSGRDASLPGSGIAIWHVDELGSRDNQSTNFNTTHANYELSLMQADNLWHLQSNSNSGDSKDIYYLGNTAAGYGNQFSDLTSPSARWWSGVASGLNLHHFSASGATMTVGVSGLRPVITNQPLSQTVAVGTSVTFSVGASGDTPLSYQWKVNGAPLSGATASAYTRSNLRVTDAGSYSVTVTNAFGSTNSLNAVLTVNGPPVITAQPTNVSVLAGSSATFRATVVDATGYQWGFNGATVAGATANSLTITNARGMDVGAYALTASNAYGSVTSSVALLSIEGPSLGVRFSEADAGNLLLTFPSVAGVDSIIEYSDSLDGSSPWLPLLTNPGTGGLITNVFHAAADAPARFYRVAVP